MSKYNKEACKRWYEKNRAKKLAYQSRYAKEHRKERLEYERKRLRKQRTKIGELLGTNCLLCGHDGGNNLKGIQLHEIHGNKHHYDYGYVLKHIKDFVPLCNYCHVMVSRMMMVFGFTWKQIKALKK